MKTVKGEKKLHTMRKKDSIRLFFRTIIDELAGGGVRSAFPIRLLTTLAN